MYIGRLDNKIMFYSEEILPSEFYPNVEWEFTDIEYILYPTTGEYLTKEEIQVKEQERIDGLTCTALDLIGFLQSCGLTLEQINMFLESNLQAKMQLTYCQNVYCKVAKSFMPIKIGDITITAKMVEDFIRAKNGEIILDEDTTNMQ